MPRVGGEAERLATIPGTVPPPTAWPAGLPLPRALPVRVGAVRDASIRRSTRSAPAHVSRCHLAVEPERRAHPHLPLAAQRGATAA